jgi:hypothetical protein
MQSFMAALLAVRVACCWLGEDAAEGLVLLSLAGASVVSVDVASRWCGLEAALGDVPLEGVDGVAADCAITMAAGAIEIIAPIKSFRRRLMNPLL